MVSSISNGAAGVSNYPENMNNGPAANAPAAPPSSGSGGGQIAYGEYNGPSFQKAPADASSLTGGEKIKEMDGMINRIKEMFSKEGAEGKDDKKGATDELGKGKQGAVDELGKGKNADEAGKNDGADELGKDKKIDDANKDADVSDKDLKSKAMEVLKSVVDAITGLFGTKESTSPAPK
ncbi:MULTISPECIES: hypothetical protein [unclassified Pseudomonas]|uniref:hypothetical protein n=1 Tax=unclassified Pseudomonas TaxID=196821 RepID=UPI001F5AAC6D|nr:MULTISPECIES: hypothetical protein [unclassified Pseudomonas]